MEQKGIFYGISIYSMDYLSDYYFIVRQSDGDNYELYPLPKAYGYSRNTNMPIVYAEITEEKLKERVREYEKAAGINSDGFIN